MDMVELVKQFGFPIAVAVYFIWDKGRSEKEHKEDLRNIAVKAVQAIDANTEAIKDQTAQSVNNTTALNNNSSILGKVSGILAARGGRNDNGA